MKVKVMRLDKEVDCTVLWQLTLDFIKEHEHQNWKKWRNAGKQENGTQPT